MKEKEGVGAEKKLLDTLNYLKEQGFSSDYILKLADTLLKAPATEEVKIPVSVFNNENLSSLETIVKYLRENLLLSFKQIAALTNRNHIALAVSYRNARKKQEEKFEEEVSPYSIPITILQDRELSVLENISCYLKDSFGLTYHRVATLRNRNDRTIWTVYQGALKKRKHDN